MAGGAARWPPEAAALLRRCRSVVEAARALHRRGIAPLSPPIPIDRSHGCSRPDARRHHSGPGLGPFVRRARPVRRRGGPAGAGRAQRRGQDDIAQGAGRAGRARQRPPHRPPRRAHRAARAGSPGHRLCDARRLCAQRHHRGSARGRGDRRPARRRPDACRRHRQRRRAAARGDRPGAGGGARRAAARRADQPSRHRCDRMARSAAAAFRRRVRGDQPRPDVPVAADAQLAVARPGTAAARRDRLRRLSRRGPRRSRPRRRATPTGSTPS